MPAKISTHVFKGMQKDINVANSSNEYLFDAHNIRFNLLDDNTLMSIVNERGNECILESGIIGLYVSHYVVGNHIVVFTYDETNEVNIIYRIDVDEPNVTVHTLFDESDLNIRPEKPLEFTSYFEANEVIKIYWVDGVNQLRFMNIMEKLKNIANPGLTPIYRAYTDSNDFNTTPELQLNETVTVELIDGNGLFPAGVIQYAFTYVNKLGAESNIFYVTKLISIKNKNGGISPNAYTNCLFKITISNVDNRFDYINCYQLLRTSLDVQPSCLLLNSTSIDSSTMSVTIYDINDGATYDPTALLFPKYPIVPLTLDLKSNTLFLGNLNEDVFEIKDNDIVALRTYFNAEAEYNISELTNMLNQNQEVSYSPVQNLTLPILRFANYGLESYNYEDDNGYTINTNPDIIRTFKSEETYRIGVLLQDVYGLWSEVIYLKDINVECKQIIENNTVLPISLIFDSTKATTFPQLETNRIFKKFRFLMVNPQPKDRRTFAQGIVIPTMYEISDRCNNTPFSYSSWFVRPMFNNIQFPSVEYRHNGTIITGGMQDSNITSTQKDYAEIQGGKTIGWYNLTKPASSQSLYYQIGVTSKIQFTGYKLDKLNGNHPYFEVVITVGLSLVGVDANVYSLNYSAIVLQEKLYDTYYAYPNGDVNMAYGEYCITETGAIKIVNLIRNAFNGNIYSELLNQEPNLLDGSSQDPVSFLTDDLNRIVLFNREVIDGYNVYGRGYFSTTPSEEYGYGTIEHYVVYGPNHGTVYGFDVGDYIINLTEQPLLDAGTECTFKVDHSVLNLYSPDIDNNYYIIDKNNMYLKIIGYSSIYSLIDSANIELITEGGSLSSYAATNKNFTFLDVTASKNVKPYFIDSVAFKLTDGYNQGKEAKDWKAEIKYNDEIQKYAIYFWHRNGSLNNEDKTRKENRYAVGNKIFARQWNCNNTVYFDFPYWYTNDETLNVLNKSGCNTGTLFVCNSTSSTKIFKLNEIRRTYIPNPDIARTFIQSEDNYYINVFASDYSGITPVNSTLTDSDYHLIDKGEDPIKIRYTSDTHVVIPVQRTYNENNLLVLSKLPNLGSSDIDYDNKITFSTTDDTPVVVKDIPQIEPNNPTGVYYPIWNKNTAYKDVDKRIYDGSNNPIIYTNPYLYIGELYRNVENMYGGPITIIGGKYNKDDSIVTSNVYIPISLSYSLDTLKSTDVLERKIFSTTYGDTWFGRWDCLKTQQTTDLDNLIVHDYASVIIESHINLNGRYDSYRNFYDQTLINAQNSNKFNDVYNLMDTFWSYKITPNYLKTTYYPNQITWSLTKQTGALVDEWTKVTAANIELLDGNKGPINKILNYKDSLFVFQDRCISQIKYNELTLMTTTEGVPVEISNSQKVTGVVKVYDGTGCINKWSIASDANGIFFIDNVNECIMWLGGSLDTPIVNLTNSKAFTLFMKANNSFDVWNPENFSNFVTFIDSAHKDVYFVNADKCLCFSLVLLEFTSFYDYQGTFGMFNINNNFYSLYDKNGLKLYRNFTGKYNEIYGELVDTSFTFIDHGESFLTDKTFTNINYILDAYDVSLNASDTIEDYDGVDYNYEKNITFNKLRVWTPFLDTGDVILTPNEDLQRKFRTWGILIQRDLKYNNTSVDRIRNNWAKFKFTFTQPDENKDIKIELMNINILSIE